MVVTKAINYRMDGTKYPLNAPEGWVFMAIALETFGPTACEKGGSFMDFAWADAVIPAQNPAQDRLNAERQAKAMARIRPLARSFNTVLVSGEVKSAYSTIGGGAITPLDPEMWRTDDPLLRYRTFSFDPNDPFSSRVDLPCWIWIERASLSKAADRLYRERMGWGPPPLPPKPRTETYLREDGQVETWDWDSHGLLMVSVGPAIPPSGKVGRPNMTTRILKLFGDRLRAGKIAERVAWEGAAISAEYGGDKPPAPDTCADRIRAFYNMVLRDEAGNIVNAGAVLDAMGYPINPDKSLSIAM